MKYKLPLRNCKKPAAVGVCVCVGGGGAEPYVSLTVSSPAILTCYKYCNSIGTINHVCRKKHIYIFLKLQQWDHDN